MKLYLSRLYFKFARAADPGKGDYMSVWVICSCCNNERLKFLHNWPRYDTFSRRYIRVRRYCKVCARKGQILFKPADARIASTTTSTVKRKDRLGGDPCGVDPRVDLGLDRLGSQGSTLDRSRVDSRVDA